MTDKEISRALQKKYHNPKALCWTPRAARKRKLRMRYGKDPARLRLELVRTEEKLELLREIQAERTQCDQ